MYTPQALRAFGTKTVELQTDDGLTFAGCIDQAHLSDAAAVVLFATEAEPGGIIVPLETIVTVRER